MGFFYEKCPLQIELRTFALRMNITYPKTFLMHDLLQKLRAAFWPNLRPPVPDEIQGEMTRLPAPLHNEFYFQYEHMVRYLKRRRNASLLFLSIPMLSVMDEPLGSWMVFPAIYLLVVHRLADPHRVQRLYRKILLQFGYLPSGLEQPGKLLASQPDHKLLHAREGDWLDYKASTWQIQQVEELELTSNRCIRRFLLREMQQEQSAVLLLKTGYEVELYWGSAFSPYLLDAHMDTFLRMNGRPPSHVCHRRTEYLLEDVGKCTMRRYLTPVTNHPQYIKYWEYLDQKREGMLRIEQPDEVNLRAYAFEKISPYAITDIVH